VYLSENVAKSMRKAWENCALLVEKDSQTSQKLDMKYLTVDSIGLALSVWQLAIVLLGELLSS
jgi:hypothetical protein